MQSCATLYAKNQELDEPTNECPLVTRPINKLIKYTNHEFDYANISLFL